METKINCSYKESKFLSIQKLPFFIDSTGGATENANVDFGTDLLRGIRLFSVGAEDLARGVFLRGESGGVFLGILELMILLVVDPPDPDSPLSAASA